MIMFEVCSLRINGYNTEIHEISQSYAKNSVNLLYSLLISVL